jgi:hypothetical protein
MRAHALLLLGSFLLLNLSGCKEDYKAKASPGINVMVQDLPCAEVIKGIIEACQAQHLPWEWINQGAGRLSIGPVPSVSLSSEPDGKIEERVRLQVKCLDSLSTRVSLEIQVRTSTSDRTWQEITEPEMLNAYGKRFLDRLLKR